MKIILGADHGGYKLKETIKQLLTDMNLETEDLTPEYDEKDDYPDEGAKVANAVANSDNKGIIFCGTGIGISIAANKINGVRAAHVSSETDAEMAAKHNNANIISIGERTTDEELAKKMVKKWLETEFEGGRHQRRVDKISDLEK